MFNMIILGAGGDIFQTVESIVKMFITLLGLVGVLIGIIDMLQGNAKDNPEEKSRGFKELMAGLGIIVVAQVLVPVIFEYIAGMGK